MPFVIRVPAVRSYVVFVKLAHKVKSYSFYVHIDSKHNVKPCSVKINLINNLSHNFCHPSVVILVNIPSNPSLYCKILIMRQLPNVIRPQIPVFVEQIPPSRNFPGVVLIKIVEF